ILVFVFGGTAILLAAVTAIWGRVWCGWACPQTVFVDAVFRRIERAIEGDSVKRRMLASAPLGWGKFAKRFAKWTLFAVCSLVISHSFLAYFVGTRKLAEMIARPPFENIPSFLFMLGTTLLVLFDFGWFREQFCTLVCPYGRFQSVLMDDRSKAVAYDAKRGEPRRGTTTGASGDCVNCYRCVQVCPTGIDIRRGLQMECIGCTACIDACDEVMVRLKKPPGLIRYQSGSGVSVRSSIYGVLLAVIGLGLVLTIRSRQPIEVSVVRAADVPYQEVTSANGVPEIINHFKIDLRNQSFHSEQVAFALADGAAASLVVANAVPELGAGESERADVFIRFPRSQLNSGHGRIQIEIRPNHFPAFREELRLVGPFL
ncbi:MAG: cytochrome c oxidase accessory protein CcoG, partial [Bdellovibrionota bacterium]